jgi:hypothetical protein
MIGWQERFEKVWVAACSDDSGLLQSESSGPLPRTAQNPENSNLGRSNPVYENKARSGNDAFSGAGNAADPTYKWKLGEKLYFMANALLDELR